MRKISLCFLIAIGVLSLIGCASLNSQFNSGDSIVIREVLPSTSHLKLGDTVVVRGQYTLQSQPKARLGLSITTSGPSRPTAVSPASQMMISAGSGAFELECTIQQSGSLHASFYEFPGGSSFGGIYFADVGY